MSSHWAGMPCFIEPDKITSKPSQIKPKVSLSVKGLGNTMSYPKCAVATNGPSLSCWKLFLNVGS